jgi:hypothetical protein
VSGGRVIHYSAAAPAAASPTSPADTSPVTRPPAAQGRKNSLLDMPGDILKALAVAHGCDEADAGRSSPIANRSPSSRPDASPLRSTWSGAGSSEARKNSLLDMPGDALKCGASTPDTLRGRKDSLLDMPGDALKGPSGTTVVMASEPAPVGERRPSVDEVSTRAALPSTPPSSPLARRKQSWLEQSFA